MAKDGLDILRAGAGGVYTEFDTNMFLYKGAMRRVPDEIMEACTINSGSRYYELFHIITPLACPTFSTTIILAITGLFVSSGSILLFS